MTDLRTRSTPRHDSLAKRLRADPALALLPLRLFLGATFGYAGLSKLADPSFLDATRPTSLHGQLALVRHTSPLSFLLGTVAGHATGFGIAIAVAEIAVGVATLAGLWGRLAALGGALLALAFYLTISWRTRPYYYGADIVFLFAWIPQLLLGTPVLSLDAWRRGRRAADPMTVDPQRRAVLATGAVGAAVLATAGIAAAVGRQGTTGSATPTTGTTSPAPSTAAGPNATTTTPASPHSTTAGSAPKGHAVGAVDRLPVGGALPFTDPATGAPAFAVQPRKGDYRGYSAVCTHAGCTVAFAREQEEFVCPCHGGTYSAATGQVLAGPPPAPLQRIRLEVADGQLIVPDGS